MLYGIIGGVVAIVIILVVVLVLKSRKDASGEAVGRAEESYEDVGVTLVERAEPEPELTLVEEAAPAYEPEPEPVYAPEPIYAPEPAAEPEPAAPVEISFDDDIADDSTADDAVEISLEIDAPADTSFDVEPAVGVEDMLAMQADADAVEVSLETVEDVQEAAPEKAGDTGKKKEGEAGFATEVDSEVDALFGDDF